MVQSVSHTLHRFPILATLNEPYIQMKLRCKPVSYVGIIVYSVCVRVCACKCGVLSEVKLVLRSSLPILSIRNII